MGSDAFWRLYHRLGWTRNDLEGWIQLTALFIGECVERKLALGTVHVYVYGIRAWFMDASLGRINPVESYYVQMCLKGAARILRDTPTPKLAFLFEFLPLIREFLGATWLDRRDWAAIILGFFGLLRKSELLAIRWQDVVQVPGGIKIWIPLSKTDPYGKGMWVHVSSRTDAFCPRVALLELGMLSPAHLTAAERPIFVSSVAVAGTQAPLSGSAFVKRLKRCIEAIGLDPKLYSGHSLRRGGATALLRAGVAPEFIQLQGRWRSDAYKLYLEWSSDRLLAITRAIGAR